MRIRPAGFLLAMLLVVGGCAADEPTAPAAVTFTEVELPGGAKPMVLTPVGDTLLIGVRHDGGPVTPGLLRRGADGNLAEVTVSPAGMYGEQAFWYSIAADERRVVAIGGKTGGAHGNVRWSVWTGSDAGLAERTQPFSTFGGYGAGDLVDAVLTPAGPALVGTWQNPAVGLDIMVWQPDGQYWVRRPSAGTALENKRDSLKFPLAAVSAGQGILVAGWELSSGRQRPAVWRSASGLSDWTMARLPDAGRAGAAVAVRCADSTCTAAGWVDGELAMWQLRDDVWSRVDDVPAVKVAADEDLTAPVDVAGKPTEVLNEGSRVVLAGATKHPTRGPTGKVTATARVGGTLYVAAGDKLWQADLKP
jgi:hypothetical protein